MIKIIFSLTFFAKNLVSLLLQGRRQEGPDFSFLTLALWPSVLILFFSPLHHLLAEESCGRTAIINYQEVLVDTSSSKKGEGLRYYLNKDSIAKKYLDEYQEAGRTKWYEATIGTSGTLLIFVGLGKSGSFTESGITSKRSLVISGASLLLVNFLISKTINYNNEKLLIRAIEEYNKRNLPRIYFAPFQDEDKSQKRKSSGGIIFGLTTSF